MTHEYFEGILRPKNSNPAKLQFHNMKMLEGASMDNLMMKTISTKVVNEGY